MHKRVSRNKPDMLLYSDKLLRIKTKLTDCKNPANQIHNIVIATHI